MSDWAEALDALEEWTRRTAAAPDQPTEPPALPITALPAELGLRARVLMANLQLAEGELLRARAQVQRQQAYGAA